MNVFLASWSIFVLPSGSAGSSFDQSCWDLGLWYLIYLPLNSLLKPIFSSFPASLSQHAFALLRGEESP